MIEYLPLACAAALTYVLVDWCRRQSRVTNLDEKYVFITGCDTGFGQALARKLDLLGFQVIAACLTEAGQVGLRNSCTSRVKTVLLDVTDHASVQRAFEFAQIVIPVSQGLWALVNNAGLGPVSAGPLEWMTVDDFEKTFEVNTLGLIDVTLTFLPLLKKSKGRLVNMSASSGRLAGLHTLPTSVSKFGVEAFSDGLRQHLKISGCQVSVHVIEPGLFRTDGHNEATLCSVYESTWRRLPDNVRNNYDDTFYNEYQKYLKYTFRAMASPHVSMVIDAYEHALTTESPRLRYTVGSDAMFSIILSYLPSCIVDWIMCKSGPRLKPQNTKIRMSSKPTSL